jgi:hypothetical protein
MGMATRLTELRKLPAHKATSQQADKQTSAQVDMATSGLEDKQTNKQADLSTSKQANKQTSGHVDTMTSGLVDKQTDLQADMPTSRLVNGAPRFQRKTYYLRPDQVERIEWVAFHQKLDISEVVRQAIEAHLQNQAIPETLR